MKRAWQTLVMSLGLGIGALWLVLPSSLGGATLRAFGRLSWGDALLLSVLWFAWASAGGLRTSYILTSLGRRLTFSRGLQVHLIGVVSASLSPTIGGNALGITWLLNRFGVTVRQGVVVSVLTLILDMTFFAWAVPLAFAYLLYRGVTLPFAAATTLIGGFSLFLLGLSYPLTFRLPLLIGWLKSVAAWRRLQRFRGRLERFAGELEATQHNLAASPWWVAGRLHVLSALLWVLRFSLLAATFYAFSAGVGALDAVTFNVLLHALAFAVPTPGASGYNELAVSWLFKPTTAAALLPAAILVWRFLTYYVFFLIGPFLGSLGLSVKHVTAERPTE